MFKLGNPKPSYSQGPQRQNRAVIVAWAFVHANASVGLEEDSGYTLPIVQMLNASVQMFT